MAQIWKSTKYPGIRYREHPSRKYNGRPDRYYVIRYNRDGKTIEEPVGWTSGEGMNTEKANSIRMEIKGNIRKGERPQSLKEKRGIDNTIEKMSRGKKELKDLQLKIREAQKVAKEEVAAWATKMKLIIDEKSIDQQYPDVPYPTITPTKDGFGLPESPGIYFLCSGNKIEYVGKAKKLNRRVRLTSHHILRPNHRISFLLFDAQKLSWAECYYIGILRSQLNFGLSAAHYNSEYCHTKIDKEIHMSTKKIKIGRY